MKSPRTRAELVSAFQAVANSGKPYRLTVAADEAALVARALRLLFSQEGNPPYPDPDLILKRRIS